MREWSMRDLVLRSGSGVAEFCVGSKGRTRDSWTAAKRAQAALAEGLSQVLTGTPVRSIVVHPPYLDDLTYGTPEWEAASKRQKGERATIRDVVDAVIFALTRPRHVALSIIVDADDGGIHRAHVS